MRYGTDCNQQFIELWLNHERFENFFLTSLLRCKDFGCEHICYVTLSLSFIFYHLHQLWQGKVQEYQKDYADVMVHEDVNRLALDVIGESAFSYQFKSVLEGDTEVARAFSHLTTSVRFGTLKARLHRRFLCNFCRTFRCNFCRAQVASSKSHV